MGEVTAHARISNPINRQPELPMDLLVDSGARSLLIGRDIGERLKLEKIGEVMVVYANGETDLLERVGPVRLELEVGGQTRVYLGTALLGERGVRPLLGQIQMEDLDLLIDCPNERLIVNPESPAYPKHRL